MNSHGSHIRTPRRSRCRAAFAAFAAIVGSLSLSACAIDLDPKFIDINPSTAQVPLVTTAVGISRLPLTNSSDGAEPSRFVTADGVDAIAFAPEDVGFGPNQFYYLRHDGAQANTSTFGTIATDGTATDRFSVAGDFDALTFVAADVGYGREQFYYLRHDPARANASTFGTISTRGEMTDRLEVGSDFDALTFAAEDVGYGPNQFYYLRHDPARANASTFGTLAADGAAIDRFGVGDDVRALGFAAQDAGFGALTFYYLRHDTTGDRASTLGTITPAGAAVDRVHVGSHVDAVALAPVPGGGVQP